MRDARVADGTLFWRSALAISMRFAAADSYRHRRQITSFLDGRLERRAGRRTAGRYPQ
jgi:hypothetical protein